jgi:hypothetical protein
MESIRQEANELYNKTIFDIKETKYKFCKIIKTINKDVEIRRLFTPEMNTHLIHLIEMWANNNEANIEYYFRLKEHHSHINNKIQNITFKNMWDDYISRCSNFRCKLLQLNDLCMKLQAYEI